MNDNILERDLEDCKTLLLNEPEPGKPEHIAWMARMETFDESTILLARLMAKAAVT